MNINKTATAIRHVLMQEADDGLGIGGAAAQDIESRIANALDFGDDDSATDDEVVTGDDESLPESDDTDSEEEDDSVESDGEDEQSDLEDEDLTLANILGIEEDKLDYDDEGNVVFKAVVNGESTDVPLKDLVKSYQLEGHVNNKSIALEKDRKEFEQNRDHVYGELTKRVETINNLVETAEKQLLSDFEGIDWEMLRATDPAEWTALRQQAMERAQLIENIKSQAGKIGSGLTEEQQKEQQQKQAEFMQQELNKMIEDNPEWADQSIMNKEFGEIGSFLNEKYGFSPEEVANALDARLMRLIRDARAYHNGRQKASEKKVEKKVPKFRKPGQSSAQRAALQKARDVKAKKQQLRKTGSTKDVAALIIDRM